MPRPARPMREELDDLEDKSWKRKSYALAQHNALPIPMPHPVYPPPKPCPPPVVIRPSRLRSRPPGAGYMHPSSYHPAVRQNYYQRPPPPDRLPTLSETSTLTPDMPIQKVAPLPPPRDLPTIPQASPKQHEYISSQPPELTTFRAPAKPVTSPPSSSRPTDIHISPPRSVDVNAISTRPTIPPVPLPRSNNIYESPTMNNYILPQQRHVDTLFLPSQPMPLQDSATPRQDIVHPTFSTFTPQPPSPSTTTFLPQQAHSSLQAPPLAPKTPPSLPSKPPPRLVQPRRSKTGQTVPSPSLPTQEASQNKMPFPPRPKEAPPAIPRYLSESQESLPSSSMHPEPLDKSDIASEPTDYTPVADVGPTSTLVSPAFKSNTEQDNVKILSSPALPLRALEDKQPKKNEPDLNNFPAESESPVRYDCIPEDSSSIPHISKVSESPSAETNLTMPPSTVDSSPGEDSTFTPPIFKNSESNFTSSISEDKMDSQLATQSPQHLPLTPSSQSRSSSLASIGGCPRTPTSIRAAPSWQPIFLAAPLTKRSTSASNSESSLSPSLSNVPPRPIMEPEVSQNFLPTPPSSPSQTHVDSVTPASSISSIPQGHGQNLTGEEEKHHQIIKAENGPDPPSCSSSQDTTLHNDDDNITPAVNNVSPIDELSTIPSKSLPATESFQTYKLRFWILALFSLIAFMQTIVWGTFGPIAESAQAAFPSWNDATIAAFPNWGPIIVVVFIFPMMWLSQRLGLQIAMIVCELFLTLGTMLRCFTSQEEVFTVMCHVSSVLFAFAACFTLSLPAMLAATWFPPNERITATAVGTLMCQLGGAGMYLGALVVRYPSSDNIANLTDQERQDIRGDIMILMYIHFGVALLLLLAVCIYFPARPPTPPSASSAEGRIDYFKAIKTLFKKLHLSMVMVVFAFSFGVPVVWVAVLNLSLKDIDINQDKAIGVAVTAIVCSSATAFIAARITDKIYGHLKVTVMALLGISSVFFLWFLLLSTQVITPTLGQVYVAVAGGLAFEYATAPLLVELAVEIGFPIPESVMGATLTFVFNLVSLVFLGLFQIPNEGHLWVSCVLLASVSLSIIPLIFVKETHKRSDTDRKFM